MKLEVLLNRLQQKDQSSGNQRLCFNNVNNRPLISSANHFSKCLDSKKQTKNIWALVHYCVNYNIQILNLHLDIAVYQLVLLFVRTYHLLHNKSILKVVLYHIWHIGILVCDFIFHLINVVKGFFKRWKVKQWGWLFYLALLCAWDKRTHWTSCWLIA